MDIKVFYCNELRECCYVAWDETLECVLIDPGFNSRSEFDRIKKFILEKSLKPVKILLTHGHFDHIFGLEDAAKYWNIPVYFNTADIPQMEYGISNAQYFGLTLTPFTGEMIDIKDGDKVTFGNTSLEVLGTPGHTPGGLCFLDRQGGQVFTGDTLFAGSIGRTDFVDGDLEQLLAAIAGKLMVLDTDVKVYPGHGLPTDIGYERMTNPYLGNQ